MNPLVQFRADRENAREAGDPMASLCVVANHDGERTQARTLVLRDVGDQLAIFINATSPKWPHLSDAISLVVYWPSVQIQYRLHGRSEPIDKAIIDESWQLRPDAPKRMDWVYETRKTQSAEIPSRQALLDLYEDVEPPASAPESARGLIIVPEQLERLDLNQPNGIHDRRSYTRTSQGDWQEAVLVP